jgi:hypothetical protein
MGRCADCRASRFVASCACRDHAAAAPRGTAHWRVDALLAEPWHVGARGGFETTKTAAPSAALGRVDVLVVKSAPVAVPERYGATAARCAVSAAAVPTVAVAAPEDPAAPRRAGAPWTGRAALPEDVRRRAVAVAPKVVRDVRAASSGCAHQAARPCPEQAGGRRDCVPRNDRRAVPYEPDGRVRPVVRHCAAKFPVPWDPRAGRVAGDRVRSPRVGACAQ